MTDQLSGKLTASESCNEGPIKVQLRTGNILLRDALIRLLGKAKDLLVMDLNRETESADPAGSEGGCDVLIGDTFDPEHFRNTASRPDELYREVKFILIGMNDDPDKFLSAIRAEVGGYLMNDASAADIVEAERVSFRGEVYCPPRLGLALFRHVAQQEITALAMQVSTVNVLRLARQQEFSVLRKSINRAESCAV